MTALISDLLVAEDPNTAYVSFEFIPPRTEKAEGSLMERLPLFAKQGPVFFDMTWGAGGRTSDTTLRLCKYLQTAYPDIPVNMHITCTNMPKGMVAEALDFARENNIRNLVALRGDPPTGEEWTASEEGFTCALDLVKYIRASYGDYFCISVAGYPEGHPGKIDPEVGTITAAEFDNELAYLKSKVDAGADLIITQLFYDASLFINFVKRCREVGITVPILPGILPVTAYASLMRMVNLCKTYIPPDMKERVDALKDDPEALKTYGVEQAVGMVNAIRAADIGVYHFHLYTINNQAQTFRVLKELDLLKE